MKGKEENKILFFFCMNKFFCFQFNHGSEQKKMIFAINHFDQKGKSKRVLYILFLPTLSHHRAIIKQLQNITCCVFSGHGPQTGLCVASDRFDGVNVCEISSWCPVEDDHLVLGKSRPLITGSDQHTVFIKNSIR